MNKRIKNIAEGYELESLNWSDYDDNSKTQIITELAKELMRLREMINSDIEQVVSKHVCNEGELCWDVQRHEGQLSNLEKVLRDHIQDEINMLKTQKETCNFNENSLSILNRTLFNLKERLSRLPDAQGFTYEKVDVSRSKPEKKAKDSDVKINECCENAFDALKYEKEPKVPPLERMPCPINNCHINPKNCKNLFYTHICTSSYIVAHSKEYKEEYERLAVTVKKENTDDFMEYWQEELDRHEQINGITEWTIGNKGAKGSDGTSLVEQKSMHGHKEDSIRAVHNDPKPEPSFQNLNVCQKCGKDSMDMVIDGDVVLCSSCYKKEKPEPLCPKCLHYNGHCLAYKCPIEEFRFTCLRFKSRISEPQQSKSLSKSIKEVKKMSEKNKKKCIHRFDLDRHDKSGLKYGCKKKKELNPACGTGNNGEWVIRLAVCNSCKYYEPEPETPDYITPLRERLETIYKVHDLPTTLRVPFDELFKSCLSSSEVVADLQNILDKYVLGIVLNGVILKLIKKYGGKSKSEVSCDDCDYYGECDRQGGKYCNQHSKYEETFRNEI